MSEREEAARRRQTYFDSLDQDGRVRWLYEQNEDRIAENLQIADERRTIIKGGLALVGSALTIIVSNFKGFLAFFSKVTQ
mgnify:CR=1 FL=1